VVTVPLTRAVVPLPLPVQLLHKLKIRSADGGEILLRVIKNPISAHLPPGCKCYGKKPAGPATGKIDHGSKGFNSPHPSDWLARRADERIDQSLERGPPLPRPVHNPHPEEEIPRFDALHAWVVGRHVGGGQPVQSIGAGVLAARGQAGRLRHRGHGRRAHHRRRSSLCRLCFLRRA
jgi:hypothetical protein